MAIAVTINDKGKFVFSGKAINITKAKNDALLPFGKCIRCYGLQLELLPTPNQMVALNQQIGNARFVANCYLSKRIEVYEKDRQTLGVEKYKHDYLPALKQEYPFLSLSDKFALEEALKGIDAAYKNFFASIKGTRKGRKMGFPKFVSANKPKGNKYSTNYTNGNIGILRDKNNIPVVKLPKVGKVRFVLPTGRSIESLVPNDAISQTRITSACISRVGQRYFVSLQLEAIIDIVNPIKKVRYGDVIAMDVGIKSFCVYGNNDFKKKEDNPRWINLHAKRLRRFQKAMSRKQYDQKAHRGSKNWKKARLKVFKEQRKCRNQRKDFQHKLSRKIANSCTVFICENLNIAGMMKNRHLAKQIQSVGWGEFLGMIKYKIEAKGGTFHKVSRWFPSSKLCTCGYKNDDLELKDRFWVCPKCHTFHDRDEHATDNLLNEGIRVLTSDFGYTFMK